MYLLQLFRSAKLCASFLYSAPTHIRRPGLSFTHRKIGSWVEDVVVAVYVVVHLYLGARYTECVLGAALLSH